jgi:outer membrane protein assembly factor BamA
MINKTDLKILNNVGEGINFTELQKKTKISKGNLSKRISYLKYQRFIDNRHKTKYHKFIKLTKDGESIRDFYKKHGYKPKKKKTSMRIP